MMGRIHAGAIEKSERLKRLRDFLTEKGEAGATTREIVDALGICAVNSAVAELRANGYRVECEFERVTKAGARIYRYRMVLS